MKAIRIHNYGPSAELIYEDVDIPVINENQVLVKVYAASVNHLEIKAASGVMKNYMPLKFPWIPGYDFAGVIKSVGSGIKDLQVGNEVYGNCNGGSYAEYLAADYSKLVKKPENISFAAAASVPHVAETAWQAIHTHGNLKKHQKVLIHGAAGGVGTYAVQFAHMAEAIVYATDSSVNEEFIKSLGADHFIDYTNTDFTTIAKNVDLVIDLVGGETQKKSYSVLKKGGKLITTVGGTSESEAKKYDIITDNMVIIQSARDLEEISTMIKAGEIFTDMAITIPLSKAAEAWEILTKKTLNIPHGKIVLEIVEPD
ncbi:MAG: NADP-dependent oxidoreductase [Bacteroidales bacterium]|jgi:NADPH:quinone reductase-like Zn-dependent oxidoreductase|nr:NADP-dependent oxidoreductase [Bacteroidales bacterium]